MKETFIIVSDSNNIVSSDFGHIKINFASNPINLKGKSENFRLILEYMKIPYSVNNITSTKANNVFAYEYNSTTYTITFPDGIYTAEFLGDYVRGYLENEGHYATDAYGNRDYYFTLGFNYALSKSYFSFYDTTTYPVTITFPSSTFYEVIGFDGASGGTQETITANTLSANQVDIAQNTDEFFVWVNIAKTNYNEHQKNSNIIYNNVWGVTGYSYNTFPLSNETGNPIMAPLNTTEIREIEIKFLDKNSNPLVFSSDITADNITFRLSITDQF